MVFRQGQAHGQGLTHGQGQSGLDLRQEKRSKYGHRLPGGHLRPRGHGQKRGQGYGQNVPQALPHIVPQALPQNVPQALPQNVPQNVPPFIPHPILTQDERMTENSSPFSGVTLTPITPKKPSSIDGIADRLQIVANLKASETRTLRIEAEDYYRIRSPILQSFREVRIPLILHEYSSLN